jgi:hypothetical protein
LKKRLFIGFLIAAVIMIAIALPVFASSPNTTDPGVVNISAGGNNGSVGITTVNPYATDTFNLTTTGTFSTTQSSRFTASGQWTGDENAIDRTATFNGTGTITTDSDYYSGTAWSVGAANLDATVTSDTSGGLQQNLNFDQNGGGVWNLYPGQPWATNRTMEIAGTGNYTLDVSDTGASIAPSLGSFPAGTLSAYVFGINASATSGGTDIQFAPSINGDQALGNNADHGQYTGMSTNFQAAYTGSPVININTQDVQSENMNIIDNFLNNTVTGDGTIQ